MGTLPTSSASEAAICPTLLSSCKNMSKGDVQLMMRSYKEFREADGCLQSLDNALKTGAKAVINTLAAGGLSIDFLKQVIEYVRYLSHKGSGAVLGCKRTWNVKLDNSEESYRLLADEYIENSKQMLNFCSELDKFLTSARNTHSMIVHMTQGCFEMETDVATSHYIKISKKLKNLKASTDNVYDHSSAERLLEKVGFLRMQQEQMLEKLKVQNEKLGKKESHASFWRKVTIILFSITVVGLLISMVVTIALAIPAVAPALGAAFLPMLEGGDWIISWFGKYENAFKDQKDKNVSMQARTRVSIKEMGDIEVLIERIVTDIDLLLFTPNFTIEEQIDFTLKDIKHKLERLIKKIKELEEEVEKCISEIRKARDTVVKCTYLGSRQQISWFSQN